MPSPVHEQIVNGSSAGLPARHVRKRTAENSNAGKRKLRRRVSPPAPPLVVLAAFHDRCSDWKRLKNRTDSVVLAAPVSSVNASGCPFTVAWTTGFSIRNILRAPQGTLLQNGPTAVGSSSPIGSHPQRPLPMSILIAPPFTDPALAAQKVQIAEDLWNTRDPESVAAAYTEDTAWRNRTEFLTGRAAVVAFLQRKWAQELDYKLRKELWGFRNNRMAVKFQYEWHDSNGQWFRSYGNELWEFAPSGLMQRREASINDLAITEAQRSL